MILETCTLNLKVLEAALMDQETMTGSFCTVLSHAFHIEELDLTGNLHIGDDGISTLPRGEVKNDQGQSHVVGL